MCIGQWIIIKTNLTPCRQIGNMNRGQTGANESFFSDACHRIGDSDRGQARASIKSFRADTCHRVTYGDGSQARAALVSATCCVSVDFN